MTRQGTETPGQAERNLSDGAWSNWLWLAEPPAWRDVLCLIPDQGASAALERHFDRVELLDHSAVRDPAAEGRYDLIVGHDLPPNPDGLAASFGVVPWSELYHKLKPGGCLMLTCHNPLWYRDLRSSIFARILSRDVASVIRRGLVKAGFATVRDYFLSPSADDPRSIVPVGRRTVASYERMEMKLSRRGRLRSHLSRAGLYPILYPAIMYLGYR